MFKIDEIIYDCPVEALSNILGKKWVAVIIWEIKSEKIRFGELQRKIEGCSKKMLTQQLDLLINNKIVVKEKKTINNTMESTYYLSDSGLKLLPIMESMIHWSNSNLSCDKEHK
ncbi:winged helix-turn-helix transcriptional regulator [Terrisporobacter glycolicus]|uniref:HTH-type transcriptional activator HxlR n=1 Tax=Terrisporobacter glycolicus ATCC 14880 = DSM 1288 TaxID=1121315 RepID=A0ABZ2ER88_9FIRM|nr:helix-turn-helix domain-containing protein [Terrisporobacter glycolicus]